MSSSDEKHSPADVSDGEVDSDLEDEKDKLLSSRDSSPTPSDDSEPSEPPEDPRFTRPTPSPMKRLALVIFLAFLFWLGFQMRASLLKDKRKSKVIHASRYSKEYKFRPAASPVITETLKDGRTRLRGALPSPTEVPTPIPKKKPGTGKISGKNGRKPKRKGASAAEKRL